MSMQAGEKETKVCGQVIVRVYQERITLEKRFRKYRESFKRSQRQPCCRELMPWQGRKSLVIGSCDRVNHVLAREFKRVEACEHAAMRAWRGALLKLRREIRTLGMMPCCAYLTMVEGLSWVRGEPWIPVGTRGTPGSRSCAV